MNKQLLFLFLFFPGFIFGQNWSIINSVEKLNFRLDGDNVITTTIWVDSVIINGNDSVFFLNRIMCDSCLNWVGGPNLSCDTCYGLKNQPQFLQRKSIGLSSGRFQFIDTANIVINTFASLNDFWLFDSTENIFATVIQIGTESVFGNSDSVKLILLSSGDTLKLSKSYGLLQYPNEYYNNSYYRLIGIEGRNVGEQGPNFADFYNINIDDMFEYYDSGYGPFDGGFAIRKYKITSKQINGDTITFGMSGFEKSVNTWPVYSVSYSIINSNLVVSDSVYHITNLYNHQLRIERDFNDSLQYDFVKFSIDTNNVNGKSLGYEYSDLSFYIPYAYLSDTMIQNINPAPSVYRMYKVGLGETDYYYDCHFECTYESHLVAYRKGTDTVGVFTPDSILTIINEVSADNNKISIFPNPTKDFINIYSDKTLNHGEVNVFNLIGEKIYSDVFTGKQKMIDCTLASGIYFVQLTDGYRVWGKIIIKE